MIKRAVRAMTTTPPECQPEPMAVKDLRCGDKVHENGYFGVSHWIAWGPIHVSYPVPGKWQTAKSGQGTLAEFDTPEQIILVCSTGHCTSSLCGYEHRQPR